MTFQTIRSPLPRRLALLGTGLAAALLGACASDSAPPLAVTPLDQHPMAVQARTDAMHLKVHPRAELSENQRRALDQLAQRASWNGGQAVDISIVTASAPDAVHAGYAIRDYLLAHKVSPQVLAYTTDKDQPADVVSLITREYRAEIPDCNQSWENLSRSGSNQQPANFGCTVNANLAAQIDDPRDIAAPQPSAPADTVRRMTVIDKYRKGEVTSAAKDDAAKGNVSDAIQ